MVDLDYLDDIVDEGNAKPARTSRRGADRAEDAFELGEALSLAGKSGKALGAYQQAARLDPRFYRAQAAMVDAMLALGDVDRAEQKAEDLLKKFNRNTDLGTARAHVYLHRYGLIADAPALQESARFHYGLAAQFCDIAIDMTPGSSYAWLRKGEVAIATRQGQGLIEGQAHFDKACAGRTGWAFETRVGTIFYEWRWCGEAATRLRTAAELSPDQACIWYWLGKVHLDCQEKPEARECFEKALRLDRDYEEAEAALAECKFLGKTARTLKSASEWVRKAQRRQGDG